jgi:hypothetical protein
MVMFLPVKIANLYLLTAISHVAVKVATKAQRTQRITQIQRLTFVKLRVLVSSCPPYKTLAGGCGKKKAT